MDGRGQVPGSSCGECAGPHVCRLRNSPGGTEQVIGTGLAFRSNYASATSLNNLRGAVDGGSIQICAVTTPLAPTPTPTCGTSAPGSIFNPPFTAQTGAFTVVADVTPAGGNDTGVGINSSPPVNEADSFSTAATVRFNAVISGSRRAAVLPIPRPRSHGHPAPSTACASW